MAEARASGRSVLTAEGAWVAVAAAREEHLGTIVLHTAEPLDRPERRTLERGALVVALVLLFGRTEAEAESKVRGELLVDLVSDRDLDPATLRERARQEGADLDDDLAIAVAEPSDPQGARVVAALARDLHGLGGVHQGQLVVLAPGDPLELGELLHARFEGATIGVAACSAGVERIPAAWREARQCVETLIRLGRAGEVSDPAGLGLARLVLGDNEPAALEEFITGTLGPVLDYDAEHDTQLIETLHAWFEVGGGKSTADALHVHPNTVSQRLERIGKLLGDDWRVSGRRLDVQTALMMLKLRRYVK